MRNGSYQRSATRKLSAISRQLSALGHRPEGGQSEAGGQARRLSHLRAEGSPRIPFGANSRELTATPRCAAFTLVEILTVIVIIGLLAGLVVGTAKYAENKAANSRAQAEIAAMEAGLESYKADNGIYPITTSPRGSLNNSGSLVDFLVGGPKKYFSFKLTQTQLVSGVVCFIDPFGRPYNYYCTTPLAADQMNQATFDLWSLGPDGLDNTADDITNWKQ